MDCCFVSGSYMYTQLSSMVITLRRNPGSNSTLLFHSSHKTSLRFWSLLVSILGTILAAFLTSPRSSLRILLTVENVKDVSAQMFLMARRRSPSMRCLTAWMLPAECPLQILAALGLSVILVLPFLNAWYHPLMLLEHSVRPANTCLKKVSVRGRVIPSY